MLIKDGCAIVLHIVACHITLSSSKTKIQLVSRRDVQVMFYKNLTQSRK